MANKAAVTRKISFIHVAQDALVYELICLRPNVHVDQSGNITPSAVSVFPFVREGRKRQALPVNSDAGAEHYVFASVIPGFPTPATSALTSNVVSSGGARFDLVAKADVTTTKLGGVTRYYYAESAVLATSYITVTHDGEDGSSAAFTSIVFFRSEEQPKDKPTGGTYANPIPTYPAGWTDAPTSGPEPLWLSRARFTPDTTNPDWSLPAPVEDSTGIEYIFSTSEEDPGDPGTHNHPYTTPLNGKWTKNPANAVWMGVAVKNNGVWEPWSWCRIKGETGKNTVYARLDPQVVQMKTAKVYRAYVDIYNGEDVVLQSDDIVLPALAARNFLINGVLNWSRGADGGRYYYDFEYLDPTVEVNMDLSIKVSFKGKDYPLTIPLRSVSDGKPGEDAYVFDLDNEAEEIPCDKYGTPTKKNVSASNPLATSKATVYKGSSVDTDWKFSCINTGCTASVGQTDGIVKVTAMSADTATVRVKASKDGMTREKVMSLSKVYPGADGLPAVTYALELSDDAIHKDKDGNLSTTSITARKVKNTGEDCEYTTDCNLICRVTYNDSSLDDLYNLAPAGSDSEGTVDINSKVKSVAFRLLDAKGKERDSETVYVVADGTDGIPGQPGEPGEPGEPGKDAVSYQLVVNPNSLNYDLNDLVYDASSVGCSVIKFKGVDGVSTVKTSDLGSEGLSLKYAFYLKGVSQGEKAYTKSVDLDKTRYSRIDFILRKGSVEICRESVTVSCSGIHGIAGKNGVWVPPPMRWTDYDLGYTFMSGDLNADPIEDHLDIVLVAPIPKDDKEPPKLRAFRCIKKYVKSASSLPPDQDSEHWKECDGQYKFLATELLWAYVGEIDFFNSQAIRIGDNEGVWAYLGVPIKGNGAILYTGGDNVSEATFVVYKDGRVVATNIHISGNSTFRGFVFHEKTTITDANYASMSTTVKFEETGSTRTELDLLKTGNWIEIDSLPTTSTFHYTSLPAIRVGVAYSDAYRDYVRQYLGNELYIYNSSRQSISIDTGEQSVEIRPEMACAFRMVLAPDTTKSPALERIKWDYTGPFQY